MTKEQLADLLIERLNEITRRDPVAMRALIESRVECNAVLADHPTVQVQTHEGAPMLGLLGVINGLVGTIGGGPKNGWGLITAVFEDDGALAHFRRTKNA